MEPMIVAAKNEGVKVKRATLASPATNFITGKLTIDPIIPVPIISPAQAARIFSLNFLYKTPDKKAPNIPPVIARGDIAKNIILNIPMDRAHTRLYQGPKNTEQTIFTKCWVGAKPWTLKIGDTTTPMATKNAKNTSFLKVILFLIITPYKQKTLLMQSPLYLKFLLERKPHFTSSFEFILTQKNKL